MKKRILITFGTRGLGQRIAKLLGDEFEIFFASSEEIPSLLLNSGKYFKLPAGLMPTYAHEVLKISLDHQIDYVLPLGGYEFEPLAVAKILFEEYDIKVIVPAQDVLQDYYVIENPPKELSLALLVDGKSLIDDFTTEHPGLDGLFVVSDSGDDFALCAVSKD
ncbi:MULTISPECIES: hypothetical protein [Sphingobacterium]|uniref:Uncharacterized protein n=2 Tax=Sphingobacterium TaxID=28453 RepID=A0ABW5YS58_9SPHI|nr:MULTISPECIES: hypothetical protein [Sphingobacterium]MBB2952802.1 hypothetical protein [Sphingobacterium sp. JUb56]MCS3555526.1 hypothetical protein [Sphingobacterium sp. JUb21]MCW2261266.1 hypothetical protein [Sphingobacterium kitahiroshimense]NJI76054.1 hypothetical protein [Sphingobacterium sp. B16(2022)]QQD14566.1 hypothetical protein JAZ75_03240 [Sphingobacterium sp. UDSM-2020]